jgi:hypothetical protein
VIITIKTLNYAVIALDILMPALYAATCYVLNLKYENQTTKTPVEPPEYIVVFYFFSDYSKGVLLLVAIMFLADALRRFRGAIKRFDMMEQLNQNIMWGHLCMLVLVFISTVLFFIYFYKLNKDPRNIKVNIKTLRAWMVSTYCNFVA